MAESQRSRLRAAARSLFAERGFGLTARQVARRAQVSPGALYRHFDGSSTLLVAAAEESAGTLLAGLGKEKTPASAVEALTAALAADPGRAALLSLGAAVGAQGVAAVRRRLLSELARALTPSLDARRLGTLVAAAALTVLAAADSDAGQPAEVAGLLSLFGNSA